MGCKSFSKFQVLYDRSKEMHSMHCWRLRLPRSDLSFLSLYKVSKTFSFLKHCTLLKSEAPGWYLTRAFQITPRTSHGFLIAVASDSNENMPVLKTILSTCIIMAGARRISVDPVEAVYFLTAKWNSEILHLNIRISKNLFRVLGNSLSKSCYFVELALSKHGPKKKIFTYSRR